MNITIIGAGSTTARALVPMLIAETDWNLHLISSQEAPYQHERITSAVVDVIDRSAVKAAVMPHNPDVIINAAALTNVDQCETDKGLAHMFNVNLVEHVVRVARSTDAYVIHLSTDFVFNGEDGPYDEDAVPDPINYYGRTKLAGENVVVSSGVDATILRTNVVYGPPPARMDFVRWIIRAMDTDTDINVVTDQYCNPTYVDDLALAILRCIERRATGLYHIGGADYLSRYQIAERVVAFFKGRPSLVAPTTSDLLDQAARRPLRGGLVPLKAEAKLGIRFRGLESGLVSLRRALFAGRPQ